MRTIETQVAINDIDLAILNVFSIFYILGTKAKINQLQNMKFLIIFMTADANILRFQIVINVTSFVESLHHFDHLNAYLHNGFETEFSKEFISVGKCGSKMIHDMNVFVTFDWTVWVHGWKEFGI